MKSVNNIGSLRAMRSRSARHAPRNPDRHPGLAPAWLAELQQSTVDCFAPIPPTFKKSLLMERIIHVSRSLPGYRRRSDV